MKKLITFLFLFVFVVSAKAQPYKTMFPEGRKWVDFVLLHVSPGGGGYTESFNIEKDTVMGSFVYKKIQGYPAFLREDLNDGKVWVLRPGINAIETLYVDYNLVKGDTFPSIKDFYPLEPDSAQIVDSVYVKDGRKHIVFKFKHFADEPFELIEGIGSNFGFLYFGGFNLYSIYLMCVEDNGTRIFSNKYYNGECYPFGFPTAVNDIEPNKNITIFPNPANDMLNISFASGLQQETNYSIVDISGRQILADIYAPGLSSYQLNVQHLAPGLYYLIIQNTSINEHIRFLKQ